MRKLIALLLVLGVAVFSGNFVYAQDADGEGTEQVEDTTAVEEAAEVEEAEPEPAAPVSQASEDSGDAPTGYQVLKKYFIDGDWRFMSFVLVCLILGLHSVLSVSLL
jgi:biopolymer transport protein ExbB